MPSSPVDPPAILRQRLAGVRGLILDADGVIVLKGEPLPGAADALGRLVDRGIPFRVVTNLSSRHRDSIAARFAAAAMPVPAGRIITAASASASFVRARHPGAAVFVIAQPDALREFEGIRLLSRDEVDAGVPAAAVVVGDAGDDLPFRDLDRAFGLIRRGAELLAMHRNLWWLTPRGPTLDSGALVKGLEAATGVRARVLGKPAPTVFRVARAAIAADLGARRLPAAAVAMVGDDVRADVLAAQRLGLRGVLVLTGKHGAADVDLAARGSRGTRPDAIAPSLAEVVAALD